MCRRSCLPGVYLPVGKLADIPFRDVNFLRYFGCSNICFLDFFISLVNFRLTWRIVAPTRQHANTPTRRKIARKLGDISKRIEREIRSHYFCNTFRLTWRIVAPTRQHANTPTRRKIARKLGDISKRIEREIRSHYFCNTSH